MTDFQLQNWFSVLHPEINSFHTVPCNNKTITTYVHYLLCCRICLTAESSQATVSYHSNHDNNETPSHRKHETWHLTKTRRPMTIFNCWNCDIYTTKPLLLIRDLYVIFRLKKTSTALLWKLCCANLTFYERQRPRNCILTRPFLVLDVFILPCIIFA